MAFLWILLNVVIGIGSFIFYTQHRRLNYWKYRGLVYDEPSLFKGSMRGCSPTKALRRVYEKFKGKCEMVGFFVYMRPAIMILDLNVMKTILSDEVTKFSEVNVLFERFRGLSTKIVRYKLAPNFNSSKMKELFPKAARGYCEILNDLVPTRQSTEVEITRIIRKHTSDVIASVFFGESNFPKELFENHTLGSFLTRFQTNNENIFVNHVKKCIENGNFKTDFLTSISSLQSRSDLDIHEIAVQSFEFLYTGFQTSTSTIECCLYELAKDENLQNSVRNEILLALEDNDWNFTYESLSKMRILNKVLNGKIFFYLKEPFPQTNTSRNTPEAHSGTVSGEKS